MRSFPNLKGALKTIQPEWRNASVQYSNASSVTCRSPVLTRSAIAVIRNFVLWVLSGNNPQRLFWGAALSARTSGGGWKPCTVRIRSGGGHWLAHHYDSARELRVSDVLSRLRSA